MWGLLEEGWLTARMPSKWALGLWSLPFFWLCFLAVEEAAFVPQSAPCRDVLPPDRPLELRAMVNLVYLR